MSDGGVSRILTLHKKNGECNIIETYAADDEKAAAFANLFFPPKPLSLPPMEDDTMLRPTPLTFNMPHIHQIIRRIEKAAPYKALGNDGIPNIVLKRCVDIVAPILLKCLHAIIRFQYFPSTWREWTTIVLRKPGWDDYTLPKSYRPIALYCTMGKIISGVMTDVTVYLMVRHSILSMKHFSRLPGKTTMDSLLYLTHCIKTAWRKKKVVTIIFLDIANTFPNAVTD
jgi:hypothetical protein